MHHLQSFLNQLYAPSYPMELQFGLHSLITAYMLYKIEQQDIS